MGKISQIYRIYIEHCKGYDIDFCGSMFSHAQLSRWTKGSMTVHITVCTEIVKLLCYPMCIRCIVSRTNNRKIWTRHFYKYITVILAEK